MEHIEIVVLGAGIGGLGMGAQIIKAGRTDFVILEKAGSVGGTWRENTYPGAACDTEAHLYCYSYDLNLGVSRLYAGRQELLGYTEKLVADFGLQPHIRFNSEVTRSSWDEAANYWVLELANGSNISASVFITAWGQLNRPSTPKFEGLEDFAGTAFHSAEWRHDVDLAGKRVASIGNAASAVQYIPEIAPVAGHLDVFQRSPNWIMPRNQVVFTDSQLQAFQADPELFLASRRELHDFREAQFARTRTGSEVAGDVMEQALEHMRSQITDPALRAKLTPDFPLACKRVLRSDDYYPALERENVDLITDGVHRFVPEGIVTQDGLLHEYEVVIFGTGFETQSFQGPVEVVGRDGASLRDAWADGAEAYLGMTVPGFPNFFMIYGPNTNLGHNSIVSMLEVQQNYIVSALNDLAQVPGTAVDVRPQLYRSYNDGVQDAMADSAWAGNCNSWYKNASGRVVNNWSGTVNEYRAVAGTFNPGDYERIQSPTVLERV
jgi:cation diffusion facilitator CzcD-associated flavoprotein CzcO